MKTVIAIALLLVVLTGCVAKDGAITDQCKRHEIFLACMKALPAGPKATVYNDWAEIVSECGSIAYYQSMRKQSQVPMECRP